MNIWKNYFTQSNILNDIQRCLLYFNLPFDEIVKDEIKPELLFHLDFRNTASKNDNFLNEMLNSFEQRVTDKKKRLANIILLQIPNS